MTSEEARVPHVLVFPFPVQGHLTPMLKLAELLSLSGLLVSFLNSYDNHLRLVRSGSLTSHQQNYPNLRFHSIPDGLPDDRPRTADRMVEMMESMRTRSPSFVKDMMASASPPVTCVVADGILGFTLDIAEEAGLPIIFFRTSSACSFWAYFCIPNLIDAGDIPFSDGSDMDKETKAVPGMEGLLRLRDLPSYCRAKDTNDPALQLVKNYTLSTTRARGLIFNTVESIESLALNQIRCHIPNVYSVGPLHAHFSSGSSLWPEDRTCISWLDSKPNKSVIFVSLGSLAIPIKRDLLEIWHGLVNSGHYFLWAIRPDLMLFDDDDDSATKNFKGRGLLVGWAPQREVLAHPAVGGFLTHAGWNSTLESMHAGVAMLCWPFFVDQLVNSRFVEKVWEVGLDMKDTCDRGTVEKMVRELMGGEKFMRSAAELAEVLRGSVREECGSSSLSMKRLIQDIRTMSSEVMNDSKKKQ